MSALSLWTTRATNGGNTRIPTWSKYSLKLDIWHFGMSAMISSCENLDDLVDQISEDLADKPVESSLLEATEALAYWCISLSPSLPARFWGSWRRAT